MPLKSYTSADILLTERKRLELPLMLMVYLAAASISIMEGNMLYLLSSTLAVGINILAVVNLKEVHVSRRLVNTGVVVATVILILEIIGSGGAFLLAMRHYLILIQLCKLFERKGNRDYAQMLAMSIVLIVAGTLTCRELWYAVVVTVHVALACYVTMVFTLKRGLDAAAKAVLPTEDVPLAPQHVAWNVMRDWPGKALRHGLVLVLIIVFASGWGVFLIAPRGALGSSLQASLADSESPTGRMPRSIHLGEKSHIYLSNRVVMELKVRGPSGGPATHGPFYLRGYAFNAYAAVGGSVWMRNFRPARAVTWPSVPQEVLDQCIVQEIVADPSLYPIAFASPAAIGSEGKLQVRPGTDGSLELTASQPPNGPVRYTMISLPPASAAKDIDAVKPLLDEAGQWDYPPGEISANSFFQPARYRPRRNRTPPGIYVHPDVAALAKEWCQDLLDEPASASQPATDADEPSSDGGTATAPSACAPQRDLAIAQRLTQKLKARCSYTLDLSDADPSRDGVEDFLFHTRRGHCEYFASALTVMCHSLGLKTRMAAGFLVDEANRDGGRYLVRDRDAHAWTEVFTPATGWVTFDATPPDMGREHTPRSVAGRIHDWFSQLRFSWNQNVVGYDNASRNELWTGIARFFSGLWGNIKDLWNALGQSFLNLLIRGEIDMVMKGLIFVLAAAATLVEALFLTHMVRNWRAARSDARNPYTRAQKEIDIIPQFFESLRRRGLALPEHQTLAGAAREAAQQFPLPLGPLLDLASLYYRFRWGRVIPTAAEIDSARRVIDECRLTIHA